jgi:hypothetical protein
LGKLYATAIQPDGALTGRAFVAAGVDALPQNASAKSYPDDEAEHD